MRKKIVFISIIFILLFFKAGTGVNVQVFATTYHSEPIPIEQQGPDMLTELPKNYQPIIIGPEPNQTVENEFSLLIKIIGFFLGFGILALIIQVISPQSQLISKIKRDYRRKTDLAKIQAGVSAFQKLEGHFPQAVRGEYQDILESFMPPPQDPLQNKYTGYENNHYGYNYETIGIDHSRYQLWCYLENLKDEEINHAWDTQHRGAYVLTEQSPQDKEIKLITPPNANRISVKEIKILPRFNRFIFLLSFCSFMIAVLGLLTIISIIAFKAFS